MSPVYVDVSATRAEVAPDSARSLMTEAIKDDRHPYGGLHKPRSYEETRGWGATMCSGSPKRDRVTFRAAITVEPLSIATCLALVRTI